MSGTTIELLDLMARWVHVIAGIMWIGNSMLFNWLDRNLRDRPEPDIYGDIWFINSGGLYIVEKSRGERTADIGHRLPAPLHWFKWQAYTTWLSGAALLIIVYYLGGRAAYLHIGAMLGTIMAGNVVFTIMPSQRDLVAALSAGREPSQAIADRAKTRSIHNNYITFPVIALMVSAHFPSLYASGGALPLLTLIAGGAAVRHVTNIRFGFALWRPTLAGVMVATALLLSGELGTIPFDNSGRGARVATALVLPDHVTFEEARRVIDRRARDAGEMDRRRGTDSLGVHDPRYVVYPKGLTNNGTW